MVKARVGARLKVAVGGKMKGKNGVEEPWANAELDSLTKRYKTFLTQLHTLNLNLQAHHAALAKVSSTSVQVAHSMAILATDTPFAQQAGSPRDMKEPQPSEETTMTGNKNSNATATPTPTATATPESTSSVTNAVEDTQKPMSTKSYQEMEEEETSSPSGSASSPPQTLGTVTATGDKEESEISYLDIHRQFAQTASTQRRTYEKMIVQYSQEWERILTQRISADLKKAEQLRVEWIHYESKVDSIQQTVDGMTAKGKEPKPDLVDKLDRNVEKLEESREAYEEFTDNLCMLLEELVNRSWRDLQPLLLEMARFDIQYSVDQAKILQQLKKVVAEAKKTGKEHGIFTSRIPDLEHKSAKELSTAPADARDDKKQNALRSPQSVTTKRRNSKSSSNRSKRGETSPSKTKKQSSKGKLSGLSSAFDQQLFVACATGDETYLKEYIPSHPEAITAQDEEGMTPLATAARCGHVDCVIYLLEEGGGDNVNMRDNTGCSALHHASEKGFDECVRMILAETNVDVDIVDNEGFTPLQVASEKGHANVVQLLVEQGKASVDQSNPEGWRAIHLAAQHGHTNCLEILIDNGATVPKQKGDKWTSLHLAAANGFEECIRLLVERGAVVDDTDKSGSTPLQKATEKGHLGCAELLLQLNADPNKMDEEGYTPLIATALDGNYDAMKMLLKYNADVDEAHPDGWTPLHLAADYGFADCIDLLLKHKANINAKNHEGWTSLHKAAEQGHADCLGTLLRNGAELEAANNDGFTALHVAAFNGHVNCVELLLDEKANVDQLDTNLCTPLYWAASEGQYECARILLERGADESLADRDGNKPKHVAKEKGHEECVKLFS